MECGERSYVIISDRNPALCVMQGKFDWFINSTGEFFILARALYLLCLFYMTPVLLADAFSVYPSLKGFPSVTFLSCIIFSASFIIFILQKYYRKNYRPEKTYKNGFILKALLLGMIIFYFLFLVVILIKTDFIKFNLVEKTIFLVSGLTAIFWKLRSKFSSQWLYAANLYNDIFIKPDLTMVNSTLHDYRRAIFALDILRLDLWPNRSFQIEFNKVFSEALEKKKILGQGRVFSRDQAEEYLINLADSRANTIKRIQSKKQSTENEPL